MDEAPAFIRERLKKLEDLSRDGIDPYPSTFSVTHQAGDLMSRYAVADDATLAAVEPVVLAGRICAKRAPRARATASKSAASTR